MRIASHAAMVGILLLLLLPGSFSRDVSPAIITTGLPVASIAAHAAQENTALTEVNAGQDPLPNEAVSDAWEEAGSESELVPSELMMLYLINDERIQAGLAPLELDEALVHLARTRSFDMAENNYFSHIAPDGTSARSLMIDRKIGPGLMGEILGRNNSTDISQSVTSVVDAFLNSPGHHAAILNPRFVSAGVGAALGAENMSYYTMLFFGP